MQAYNGGGVEMPLFSDALLEALAEKFPDKCPNPTDSERAVWMQVGAASVVRYLRDQRRRQKEAEGSLIPLPTGWEGCEIHDVDLPVAGGVW
jgi:hypothetical protein